MECRSKGKAAWSEKKVGLFYSTGRGPKGSNAINLTQLVFRVSQFLKMSSFFEVKRFLKILMSSEGTKRTHCQGQNSISRQ